MRGRDYRFERKKRGLLQVQVAEEAGIDVKLLIAFENETATLSEEKFWKLWDATERLALAKA